ncbi:MULTISPECIES: Rrf2 family transcriptional regulator [Altibacter]|uniref:RrF2 family transcriptional regulator n=1 Tax=Altibacter TaxID=1535231 RepID=UPI0005504908|nr:MULTISPECIES: Rrf2 family transcriptional regulator [Altibacter]MCW9037283.1 Rrf2 family transcriptional regulator [Altibacter sp.]
MLSNASKYAIRSILYLATHTSETKKINVKVIAEELETPPSFLAKLLQQLTNNGLVSSTKGPNGGFYLDEKNRKKSLWDVITCIDGTDKFNQCFLGLSECNDRNPCPAHAMVAPFKEKILTNFRDKTIAEFAAESLEKGTYLTLKQTEIL